MSLNENERITIPDDDGVDILFEIIFKFDVDATGHTYIVVAAVEDLEELEEDGELEIQAFRYEDNEDGEDDFNIYPIESDEEWDLVEEMIEILEAENEI